MVAGQALHRIRGKKLALGQLDRLSREFLDWIVARCEADQPLYVQEIVIAAEIASPATTHKCVQELCRAKLIELVVDQNDLRRRQVQPTALALEELLGLNQAFEAWIKAQ